MAIQTKQRGFTLLELLIVVGIIAIIVGSVGLNFNRNLDNIAHSEAKRFARVLSFTKEYSAYTGRILSMRLDERNNSYFFLYVDPISKSWGKLEESQGNQLLNPHTINNLVEVKLEQNQAQGASKRSPVQNEQEEDDQAADKKRNQAEIALITPFSDYQPASLRLRGETREYIVSTDEYDNIEIQIENDE